MNDSLHNDTSPCMYLRPCVFVCTASGHRMAVDCAEGQINERDYTMGQLHDGYMKSGNMMHADNAAVDLTEARKYDACGSCKRGNK
eukprot:GHVU01018855.1.p1 GENE.GHVU01018855.1~~GHVU01018855.1.p1  ORF type:complete len:101 (+),score=3.14 GHVU01018855.1:48-305(+)